MADGSSWKLWVGGGLAAVAILFGIKECRSTYGDDAAVEATDSAVKTTVHTASVAAPSGPVIPPAQAVFDIGLGKVFGLQKQSDCPPYSLTGATCEVQAGQCTGWIRRAPGTAVGVVYIWEPLVGASPETDQIYASVRYLDRFGIPHRWKYGSRVEGAMGWEYCFKKQVIVSYWLEQSYRS